MRTRLRLQVWGNAAPRAARSPSLGCWRSDDNFSYSAILSYDVTDTFNVYASYSTGFKPGGFNLSYEAAETGIFEFEEEDASSWEIGAKGTLLDGSLVYAITYFNQEIENFQSEH